MLKSSNTLEQYKSKGVMFRNRLLKCVHEELSAMIDLDQNFTDHATAAAVIKVEMVRSVSVFPP